MSTPTHKEVMAACASVNAADDRLGSRSDHEGDENGPTYHAWQQGRAYFARYVESTIKMHERAIDALLAASRLNQRRPK